MAKEISKSDWEHYSTFYGSQSALEAMDIETTIEEEKREKELKEIEKTNWGEIVDNLTPIESHVLRYMTEIWKEPFLLEIAGREKPYESLDEYYDEYYGVITEVMKDFQDVLCEMMFFEYDKEQNTPPEYLKDLLDTFYQSSPENFVKTEGSFKWKKRFTKDLNFQL